MSRVATRERPIEDVVIAMGWVLLLLLLLLLLHLTHPGGSLTTSSHTATCPFTYTRMRLLLKFAETFAVLNK